ncbi:MAG: hypothetical protein ACI97P_002657 [Arcticibacterium sp.]|jgi:hypothetical protein
MKKSNKVSFLLLGLLMCSILSFAQTTRITFPLNGMVFQQNNGINGSANIPFSAIISGVDATMLKRSGVATEFISESLGHKNLQTTESYLDSFENEARMKHKK